jgi:hypothetical protein
MDVTHRPHRPSGFCVWIIARLVNSTFHINAADSAVSPPLGDIATLDYVYISWWHRRRGPLLILPTPFLGQLTICNRRETVSVTTLKSRSASSTARVNVFTLSEDTDPPLPTRWFLCASVFLFAARYVKVDSSWYSKKRSQLYEKRLSCLNKRLNRKLRQTIS